MKRIQCLCGKKCKVQGFKQHEKSCKVVAASRLRTATEKILINECNRLEAPRPIDRERELHIRAIEAQNELAKAFAQMATTFSTIFAEWRR
jgi:hypothetical protein